MSAEIYVYPFGIEVEAKKRRSSKQANLFSFVFSFSLFLYLFPELVAFEHWFMNSQKQSSGKIYQQMAENSVLQQHFHYGQRYGRQSRETGDKIVEKERVK